MRKLLVAATALGLLTASLPAMAADNTATKPEAAKTTAAKPKVTKVVKAKHYAKRTHRKHLVRHHRHHRMAMHKAHRKHVAFHKKHHQVRHVRKAPRNS
jgi:hypothetical protein